MKMELKGKQSITYSLNGEKEKIEVIVELKQKNDIIKHGQNIWYAIILLNSKEIKHPDAPYCVNAQYMAEKIIDEEIGKLRAEHGRALRLKRK